MSSCKDTSAVVGCYTGGAAPVSVTIHYTYDYNGAPQVHITDLSGAVIAGATLANTSLGACQVAPPQVEWQDLCDVQANGTAVQFSRRVITTFSTTGVPTNTVADFKLDRITAYATTGTVGECPICPPLTAAQRGVQAIW
jgi:hypothetical protein